MFETGRTRSARSTRWCCAAPRSPTTARSTSTTPSATGSPTGSTAGSPEPVVAEVAGFSVGLMTCYDLRFPEHARALVDRGAEVLAVPAAWVAGERKVDHWRTLLRARAIENTVFVVAAAQPGPRYTGHSMVVDPLGDVLVEADEDAGHRRCGAGARGPRTGAADQPVAAQPSPLTLSSAARRYAGLSCPLPPERPPAPAGVGVSASSFAAARPARPAGRRAGRSRCCWAPRAWWWRCCPPDRIGSASSVPS